MNMENTVKATTTSVSTTTDDQTAANAATSRAERLREQTDHKIVQSVLQIATTEGVGAVSIEEVARRSGVAKTTIYRRYRNTEDMLRKLQSIHLSQPGDISDLAPTRDNLRLLLERMMGHFNTDIGITAVGIVLSSHNGYFHHIVSHVIVPEQNRFADFLRRGQVCGILRHQLDARFLFNTIIGSMVACQALPGTTHGSSWAKNTATLIWNFITETT